MNRRLPPSAWPLALLLLAGAVRADDPPIPAVTAPGVPTPSPTLANLHPSLAQALGDAAPSKEDLLLTVGADKVSLPKEAVPPAKGEEAAVVAQTYGRITQEFGTVTAIAPPTMTLLNTDPGTPNPYDGMPPADALKMLLGTLTDVQWKALTGPDGLALSSLGTDTQRGLVQALFPGDSLTLHPGQGTGSGQPEDRAHLPKMTQADVAQAKIRLGQRVMVGIPVVGKDAWMNSPPEAAGGKPDYEIYGGVNAPPTDTLYGVKVRQEAPNALKPSDLDLDQKRWEKPVRLEGVQTVADLVARIGQATQTELYADRRYEKRAVLLIAPKSPPSPPARAKDLLRALALCVAGAYRRVGPAYVLTDDVMGAGTRRMILSRFAQAADIARHAALSEAADTFIRAHGGVDDLPTLDGQRAFSGAQKAQAARDNPDPRTGQGTQFMAPLDQLTPQQQDTARRFVEQWEAEHAALPQGGEQDVVTLSGKLLLMAQPMFLLQSPTLPGVVSLDNYFQVLDLFRPSHKLAQELRQKQAQAVVPPSLDESSPKRAAPPTLASLLARTSRRAVIARRRTAQDVDTLVVSLQALHLNQLWLDVFSGGKSHLDKGQGDAPDILTEALARTKGTGITVIPTLDLLKWAGDAPEGARDLTMLGETSAQAGALRQRSEAILSQGLTADEADRQPAPTDLSVSPVAPQVRQALTALVRRLAATRGVAALALRETVPPGYDRPAESNYGVQGDTLGYTPPLRLAFLRKAHVDPLDLDPEAYEGRMNADLSLPGFDDEGALGSVAQDWDGFRSGADLDLLQTLLAAARLGAGRPFPFLIKQQLPSWPSGWYGLWDDPRAKMPEISQHLADGGSDPDFAAYAHTQSRTNLYEMDRWATQSKEGLVAALQEIKPGWDGIVLDFTGGGDANGNPLAGLVKSLTPPAPKPVNKPGTAHP